MDIKIKITPDNAAGIKVVLDEVQHRASARLLDADNVAAFAASAEKQLEKLGLPKALRPGALYEWSEGGICGMPNSYKKKASPRASTWIRIERRGAGWYLVGVERRDYWPDDSGEDGLILTKDQHGEAVRRFANSLEYREVA
jgi:hypothetical protein